MRSVTPDLISTRDKASTRRRGGTQIKQVRHNAGALLPVTNPADNLVALMHVLRTIDLDSPKAKLNENTISDNNGGRIIL